MSRLSDCVGYTDADDDGRSFWPEGRTLQWLWRVHALSGSDPPFSGDVGNYWAEHCACDGSRVDSAGKEDRADRVLLFWRWGLEARSLLRIAEHGCRLEITC